MGNQIIRQPDGHYAVFSTVTGTIIRWDATKDEIVEWFAEQAAEDARQNVRRKIEHVAAGEARRAYFQFATTWDEALETDRKNGGDASADKEAKRDMTERPIDVLRHTVLAEGGEWTARRAVDALDGCYKGMRDDGTVGGLAPTQQRARVELNKLVDQGLLVKHGKIGKLWTLTDEAERKRSEDPERSET
ncbi:MAG: hypothetical protein JWO67_4008 [Streptosporangiaceae bacterium]|nr:hypothetical protein [Streptosporangiaceae bacterium]